MPNKNANIDIFFDADYASEPDGLGKALRGSALIEDFLDD